MPDLVIVPRSGHTVSRSLIDPDALKVLYRLHSRTASRRLPRRRQRARPAARPAGRRTSTSAPRLIRTRSRSCSATAGSSADGSGWRTCGSAPRRSRSRRSAGRSARPSCRRPTRRRSAAAADAATRRHGGRHRATPIVCMHRDNTFGTPEEDAFRRDFTINALFYDIGDVLDHRLHRRAARICEPRVVRCIGDPTERFQEDPVRMLRAVAMAARLDFTIDPPIDAAIAAHRARSCAKRAGAARSRSSTSCCGRARPRRRSACSPSAGCSSRSRRELQRRAGDALWESLGCARRLPSRGSTDAPEHADQRHPARHRCCVPLGHSTSVAVRRVRRRRRATEGAAPLARHAAAGAARHRAPAADSGPAATAPRHEPVAAREAGADASRAVPRRRSTWLEIHGQAPEAVEHWRGFIEAATARSKAEAPAASPASRRGAAGAAATAAATVRDRAPS